MQKCHKPCLKLTSLAMNVTSSCSSRHGCRNSTSFKTPDPSERMVGRTYGMGAETAATAKLTRQSSVAIWLFNEASGPK